MPEYRFGKLRGDFCIVWYDDDGTRHRHTLGTADKSKAERLAPALYAELTRPTGKSVADLWKAYEGDMAGRATS